MRTVLILNPGSGASLLASNQHSPQQKEEAILEALRKQGIEPEVQYTTPEESGRGLAQQAAAEGADLIIAAGGDGTLHAVAGGLVDTQSTLGILPMGTMNNIARSLKIPEDLDEACHIIANGATSLIDVGKMNDHIFLEVAGIGLEAALFPAAEEVKSKHWLSNIHGVFKGLGTLFSFQPTKYTVSFDGRRSRTFHAIQISICNSPFYGARLQFAPNAVMDDGFLDVLIYKNFSKLDYLRHAISISQGRRALATKVTQRKIKTLHVDAALAVDVHADGVPKGHTPVSISIQSSVLHVRVPEKTATGPNLKQPENKRQTQKAQQDRLLEEKGPMHVQ
ncbi:diacylglycerol/lipid kinase family protein [Tengunoibacter tsumagoiensis]|uniref:Diacylglycerol kinase n=1 Tax=Tengunoibacter tsumagoiensis TaxID=2014871 RepID=A0A402A497_9CHLR|nr:diacylglycerol kinase family protein [Tengunoibacter tsumagoiensis]GCE13967.1 diacylglycerol kinase [Tengunoibacter tsumagoiensis]